jgi:poly(beta-D-mannuronate) lyase
MAQVASHKYLLTTIGLSLLIAACSSQPPANGLFPADIIDLSYWKVTLPLGGGNGKVKEVDVNNIKTYYHPDFFYVNNDKELVFVAPNKAQTTSGSSNTRSELRQMLRGSNTFNDTHDRKNNFTLAGAPNAQSFASIGGKLEATLKVDAVALHAGYPDKRPAYSVVVGQIHAGKDTYILSKTNNAFGWGNEPIKIYYKKWPNHAKGSVFWNYERNLPKNDPNRIDIAYPVWGNTWENHEEPGDNGIALGEEFSYVINVHENIMYLTFTAKGHPEVKYQIDLSNNIDAYGKVDPLDNPKGYLKDWHYFKAGAYNQCSTKDADGDWYTKCPGTGDWATDKMNGDYTQVTFSRIALSPSEPPKE